MVADPNEFPDDVAVEYNPEDEPPATHAAKVKNEHEDELLRLPFVSGVGLGKNAIGDDAILIYLEDKSAVANLPDQIDGVDVITEVTGVIEAARRDAVVAWRF